MNLKKSIFTGLMAFIYAFNVTAQTADEIIAKHIDAIGGKDVLNKTVSIYFETSTSVMGNDAPGKTYILNGKGFKTEMEVMGNTMTQCASTNGCWMINPMSGGSVEDMPADQARGLVSNMTLGGVFMDYATKGTKVELAGKEKVGNADAFKLIVTQKDGKPANYYIDANTYYIVKAEAKGEMMGQEVTATSVFSDFKKLDNGYVMAHTTNLDLGQFQLETKITKVELNKAIDEKIFKKP